MTDTFDILGVAIFAPVLGFRVVHVPHWAEFVDSIDWQFPPDEPVRCVRKGNCLYLPTELYEYIKDSVPSR